MLQGSQTEGSDMQVHEASSTMQRHNREATVTYKDEQEVSEGKDMQKRLSNRIQSTISVSLRKHSNSKCKVLPSIKVASEDVKLGREFAS